MSSICDEQRAGTQSSHPKVVPVHFFRSTNWTDYEKAGIISGSMTLVVMRRKGLCGSKPLEGQTTHNMSGGPLCSLKLPLLFKILCASGGK